MTTPAVPTHDGMDEAMDDIDALVAQLRQVVQQRREAGEYPPDLEEELDEHFNRQVPAHLQPFDIDAGLRALDAATLIGRHRLYTDSRTPVGSMVHKAVGRVVVRQTDSLLRQLQEFAVAVRALLHAIVERLPDDDLRDTAARVDVILDRLAAYERTPGDADAVVRALAARLDRLESWMEAVSSPASQGREASPRPLAPDDRVQTMLAALQLQAPVLDLSDAAQPLAQVEARPDDTLGGVLLLAGAERLPMQTVSDLLNVAAIKLRKGGRAVLLLSQAPVLTGATGGGRAFLTWSPGLPADFVTGDARRAGFGDVAVQHLGAGDESTPADVPPAAAEELERLRRRIAELERRTAPYLLVCTR